VSDERDASYPNVSMDGDPKQHLVEHPSWARHVKSCEQGVELSKYAMIDCACSYMVNEVQFGVCKSAQRSFCRATANHDQLMDLPKKSTSREQPAIKPCFIVMILEDVGIVRSAP
jgi:hypothetical protein